jgi:uncharacterized membrane protein YqjE
VTPDTDTPTDIGSAIQQVTELSQKIIHEEIELAKAEVSEKLSKLAKGAAIGAAAGVFVLAGLIYFLHFVAWLLYDLLNNSTDDDIWLGYVIVAASLFLLAGLAGFIAFKLVKRGAPPTPKMAIDEAQKVRATISESGKS